MIYLYDPRTNVYTKTTYEDLKGITGQPYNSLVSMKSRKMKLSLINCYIMDDNTTVQQRREWYTKEKFDDEYWLTIKGSNNQYLLSNYGRVKRQSKQHQRLILPFRRKDKGVLFVKVRYNDKYGEYQVSRLVADHFIGDLEPGKVVYHKNRIRTDDHVANLKYITRSELGKIVGYSSRSIAIVQLDPETNELLGEYRSIREAGRKCYLSHEAIRHNLMRKSEVSGGYVFMYADDYERAVEVDISNSENEWF
ncbi:NUMOD4 motif-containing protein [Virgibacillus subterraneus]|uniref:NUMOD4 motif-containing protein n=1 Tax=Virgibacillus subterraneus TaxID=621109 RepID=A0A1H9EAX6_9BACI|nr:HNH endonuclease [Virgibacillus subterraneus]SEQ22805.1 NUMOD4 motif-containing protein [Virgibacillus subterraneus]